MAPARHALPWCEATVSSTLAPPKSLSGLAAGSVLPSWAVNRACPMSTLAPHEEKNVSPSVMFQSSEWTSGGHSSVYCYTYSVISGQVSIEFAQLAEHPRTP